MKLFRIAVAVAVVAVVSLGLFAVPAIAEDKKDEKKLEVRQNDTMADVMGRLVGTTVEVSLKNGTAMSGKLTKVHQNLAYIAELSRKEFYDAVVRIEDVSAVTVRMRDR